MHERFSTPHVAIVAQAAIVIVLATTGTFEELAIIANVATLVVYAACCVAVLVLRRLESGRAHARTTSRFARRWAARFRSSRSRQSSGC